MEELTIPELQEQMRAGQSTSRALVEGYLERIELVDRQGPRLNAVIELNPDALAAAEALDRERAQGQVRGPLHGIPVLIKDNIDTADRMTTTAGSLALEGWIPPRDAFLVSRLRAAGVVLLGKANLSEWANFRSTRSLSGWSSRGGQTRNPYALDRSPCGSSSGSAAAAAAGLCAAAVGTETDGSIICPAQTCGVVGIKPTLGLVSRSGVIPIAHSQDTAGPLARTVLDAALLLGALAGPDPQDLASQDRGSSDYTTHLGSGGLQGSRIGVVRRFFGSHPDVNAVMEGSLQALKALGAELVDPVKVDAAGELGEHEVEVLRYEFKADLNAYLAAAGPGAPVHSLEEVIAFNERNRARVMPFFGQERMLAAQAKGPLTEAAYRRALETGRRLAREDGIDAVLKRHRLDALVAPSGQSRLLDRYRPR